MSFNSPQRPRVRGKPFRLFTDDLPKIDFNNSYLQENRTRLGADRGFHDPGPASRRHGGLQYDQISLPALGSPGWNVLTPEPRRPQSQVLSPNIAQLNKKIRRRHTVKERPSRIILDQRFQGADGDLFGSVTNGLRDAAKPGRIADVVKDAFVRTPSTRSFRSKSSKSDDTEDAEKPKSILQKLLDESARDSARRRMVEDGFKLFTQDKYAAKVPVTNSRRAPRDRVMKETSEILQKQTESSIPQSNGEIQQPIHMTKDNQIVDNNVQENKGENKSNINHEQLESETLKFGTLDCNEDISNTNVKEPNSENPKPGILKNNTGTSSTKIKREKNLKPRLIHQDNIQELSRDDAAGGDVKVTVHADVPFNRPNALLFDREGSHKPRTKRRVNFDKYLEENKDATNEDTEAKVKDDCVPKKSIEHRNNDKENIDNDTISFMKYRLPSIRKRDSVRRKGRNRNPDLKTIHVSSFPTQIKEPAREELSIAADKFNKFDKVTENLKDPRVDPFWKEVKEPLEDRKDPVVKTQADRKTESAEVTVVSSDDKAKLASALSPGKVGRHRRSRSLRRSGHSSVLYTPTDSVSTTTSGSIFGNSADLDSLPDVQSFLEELDMEEHVNRGLLGEDLIKAYRIWDRKRKAFSGGLRKIEAPGDPDEEFLFPKAFGAVRTYKIPTQAQEIKHPPTETSEPLNSVFIGSF